MLYGNPRACREPSAHGKDRFPQSKAFAVSPLPKAGPPGLRKNVHVMVMHVSIWSNSLFSPSWSLGEDGTTTWLRPPHTHLRLMAAWQHVCGPQLLLPAPVLHGGTTTWLWTCPCPACMMCPTAHTVPPILLLICQNGSIWECLPSSINS
jgi:hypothetical protein